MRSGIRARIVGAIVAGGLLAIVAATLLGCPDAAGDCNKTLSCPPPPCEDAGDAASCDFEDAGDYGGDDAQGV